MTLPQAAQQGPYTVLVEGGKLYSWCTCGLSQTQPFCDGAHKGTDFKSLKWTAPTTGTVYLCGCKQTQNGPLCDGSHSKVKTIFTDGA